MNTQTALTEQNAPNVYSVINIAHPEWGAWRFTHNGQPLVDNDYADVIGTGSNSKVLHKREYKFWAVSSFNNH
jgi:hypothetical protein